MLKEKVLETITKYNLIESGDRIVLGVSGGPDSITMLVILNELKEKLNFEIIVAHINHGIRENAKIDEEYVKNFCDKLEIKCYVLHSKVKELAREEKIGLEEAGRKVRYDFFDEVLEKENAKKIAIAHNKNDNGETIIMNILRGSGISGLKGIEPKNGKYIRPLIEISRDEIEEFSKDLNPRHDESNDENEFTRNKIRNIVIPYIKKEFNPNIIEGLDRLSKIAREEEDFIEKETVKEYDNIIIKEFNINLRTNEYDKNKESMIILDLKKFNNLDTLIQKKVLLYSIKKIFGSCKGIEKIHLDDMIKLCNNNIGNKFLTPNKHFKIVIKNKQIILSSVNSLSVRTPESTNITRKFLF